MSQIIALARREFRAYFSSPVALLFLGVFLFVVLYAFFWVATFFKRDIADVRPLFEWLPILLIFLVSALTMRLWSDEHRSGTVEILFTLPVPIYRLVIAKFLAGWALVAIALGLTLSLPISVSLLGDLDWGPVFGGYLAAMLLAAAYLAVGLCISATTSNAVVSLLVTGAACGTLYLIGSETIAGLGSNRVAETLRLLGTGSRFESIERGVLDLRDILYYSTICVGFLFLNSLILEAKKWSEGEETRPKRLAYRWAGVLVVANLVLLNVAVAALPRARVDLTERKEYSISPATLRVLGKLEAPLLIRGYFSAKTHPKLAPLVPRIRDLLYEYGVVGGERVVSEFVDPQQSPGIEKEANEDFGIKSIPFQFADRHEAGVVNSYFDVLIKYGDKFEKLSFQDLIEVKATGMNHFEVRLRNLEYDLTRAIKKVVQGFEPIETLFSRVSGKIKLNAYISAKTLPENLQKLPGQIGSVARELEERSGGKFVFSVIDPSGDQNEALRRRLWQEYGFKPLTVSLFTPEVFYLHLVLESGDRRERIYPSPDASESQFRDNLTAALKRLTPGFLKTVGLFASKAAAPPPNPMMGRQPPPPPQSRHRLLARKLSETYTVKEVSLKKGRVPGDIDVLLVLGPDGVSDAERFAIDQFLMRGGAVVIGTAAYSMSVAPGRAQSGLPALGVKKLTGNLSAMLKEWGVEVKPSLVLDQQNEALPLPVERNVAGLRLREVKLVRYPFWVDIRSAGMSEESPVVSGLPSVTLQWASALGFKAPKVDKSAKATDEDSKKGLLSHQVLLRSSKSSWLRDETDVQPDFMRYPRLGFASPESKSMASHPLALSLTGSFVSTFKGKPSPVDLSGKPTPASASKKPRSPGKGTQAIERSPASSRLVVVGSADFVRDDVLNLSRMTGTDRFMNNLQLVHNLVDWAVADEDLLTIRSRGAYARTLKPMDSRSRSIWEIVNYGVVILALGLIVGIAYIRRRNIQPMRLVPTNDDRQASNRKEEEGE